MARYLYSRKHRLPDFSVRESVDRITLGVLALVYLSGLAVTVAVAVIVWTVIL